MTLKELQIGKSAIVDAVGGAGALRQHFLDMGLIPGVEVTLVKLAPMGDPMELRIHGYELTLRVEEYQKANETLRQEMQSGISEEDIGEMARTELGYAEPGERIFVDTSSR